MPAPSRFAPLFLLGFSACSASQAGPTGGDGGSATGGTAGTSALALRFEGPDPLILPPSSTDRLAHPVTLRVTPTGDYLVRFALANRGGGGPADAALSSSEARTDGDGRAVIDLTPPSIPTSFELRASISGPVSGTTSLEVIVEASNLATLDVYPTYGGSRPVSTWVAAVYDDGRTCADLEGTPPIGNPPPVLGAESSGRFVSVRQVPVGVPLAVTLRAEHFAGGCSDFSGALEGERNRVDVAITNRPIQLGGSTVTVALGLTSSASLTALFEQVIAGSQAAVAGGGNDDVEVLLDAMGSALPDASQASFSAVRRAEAWASDVHAAHGAGAESALRDALGDWMRNAVGDLARDDAIVGSLSAVEGDPERTVFALASVFGHDPAIAAFAGSVDGTWSADASDRIAIGTTVTFNPSALLVRLALEPAKSDVAEAQTLAQALAHGGLDCDLVALTLSSNGVAPGIAFDACDMACVVTLCGVATEELVARASDAYALDRASLVLSATGAAGVGAHAELVEAEGTWVGDLTAAGDSAEVGGAFSAGE